MLAITESAAEAINALVSRGEMPEGSGARIAADGEGQGLELALVPGPAEDDAVVEGPGATVYLEQSAAQVLGDKVLDIERYVESTGEEQLRFAIVPKDGLDGPSRNGSA
jgi:iron-sulfur cluster assembly protein